MDIMIDIETMSSRPNAAVASIGAVAFDPAQQDTVETINERRIFYRVLNLEEQPDRHFDPGTIYWWLQQSMPARGAICAQPRHLPSLAMREFIIWYEGHEPVNTWCYGATFDHVVLTDLFREWGLKYPPSYRNQLCARTLTTITGNERPRVPDLVGHSAVDDAILQVIGLQQCFARLRAAKCGQ